ncbi:MAG: ABC transporter substrate-binding protein [Anaerolineae bacterium]|nr:ABC transporter substrate-binding protein [Anaerolineae bacterium]
MKMKIFFVISYSVLFALMSACAPADPSPTALTPITIQLGSGHQALYGGLYVAEQNGYFEQEGLRVNFLEGSPSTDLVAPLVDGTAQFGLMGASAIISARAEEQPIRAIATVLRRDPVVFFSLSDSGISKLEDFIGKKVSVSERLRPRLRAMLGHAGIDSDEVIEVGTGGAAGLYNGDVDVASGLVTSTVLSVQQDGYTVNIIYPDDYGVHFYSVTIYASDDYIASNPEIVTRFLRAALQGWTYAVENPQPIGEMVPLYDSDADPAFETASMTAYLPYINTGENYIGWMQPEVWAGMVDTMLEQGEISAPLDVDDLYTMEFLQQIYGENTP